MVRIGGKSDSRDDGHKLPKDSPPSVALETKLSEIYSPEEDIAALPPLTSVYGLRAAAKNAEEEFWRKEAERERVAWEKKVEEMDLATAKEALDTQRGILSQLEGQLSVADVKSKPGISGQIKVVQAGIGALEDGIKALVSRRC